MNYDPTIERIVPHKSKNHINMSFYFNVIFIETLYSMLKENIWKWPKFTIFFLGYLSTVRYSLQNCIMYVLIKISRLLMYEMFKTPRSWHSVRELLQFKVDKTYFYFVLTIEEEAEHENKFFFPE